MVFESLEPVSVPVKIGAEDYVLRQLDEAGNVRYESERLKLSRYDVEQKKVVSFDQAGAPALEPLLVQLCLFKVLKNGEGQVHHEPTTPEFVGSLPGDACPRLHERAKALNPHLFETVERTVKN